MFPDCVVWSLECCVVEMESNCIVGEKPAWPWPNQAMAEFQERDVVWDQSTLHHHLHLHHTTARTTSSSKVSVSLSLSLSPESAAVKNRLQLQSLLNVGLVCFLLNENSIISASISHFMQRRLTEDTVNRQIWTDCKIKLCLCLGLL